MLCIFLAHAPDLGTEFKATNLSHHYSMIRTIRETLKARNAVGPPSTAFRPEAHTRNSPALLLQPDLFPPEWLVEDGYGCLKRRLTQSNTTLPCHPKIRIDFSVEQAEHEHVHGRGSNKWQRLAVCTSDVLCASPEGKLPPCPRPSPRRQEITASRTPPRTRTCHTRGSLACPFPSWGSSPSRLASHRGPWPRPFGSARP